MKSQKYEEIARLAHGAATGRPPRYAWKDELDSLGFRMEDKHRAHAGCIGGLFAWVLILTLIVIVLLFR